MHIIYNSDNVSMTECNYVSTLFKQYTICKLNNRLYSFFIKLFYLFMLLILDSYYQMEIFMKEDSICGIYKERESGSTIKKMEE